LIAITMTTTTTDPKLEQLVRVDALETHLELLSAKDRVFAESLIGGYRKYKKISEAQMAWVLRLTQRAQGFEDPYWKTVEGFQDLLHSMQQEKAKSPRAKYESDSDIGTVVLNVAGNKAKHPGTVTITNGGKYGEDQIWYGFVSLEGVLHLRPQLGSEVITVVGEVVRSAQAVLCQ
jgi:hypothetical protein